MSVLENKEDGDFEDGINSAKEHLRDKDEEDSRYEESLKNDNEEVFENIMESIDKRKHGCEQCGKCLETEKELNGHIGRAYELECTHTSVVI